jgi:hypothetical protein
MFASHKRTAKINRTKTKSTMKIAALFPMVVLTYSPAVITATAMLRSPASPAEEHPLEDEMQFAGATIYLKHATTAGLWDNAVIAKAFNEAYNTVHKNSGYTIQSGYVANEVEIPEPAGGATELGYYNRYWSYNWYNYGYNCRFCGPSKFKPILLCSSRCLISLFL